MRMWPLILSTFWLSRSAFCIHLLTLSRAAPSELRAHCRVPLRGSPAPELHHALSLGARYLPNPTVPATLQLSPVVLSTLEP